MKLSLNWHINNLALDIYIIGDVRSVLNSSADKLIKLNDVRYGLGALSIDCPATTGEGIVFRGYSAITPPTEKAGLLFTYQSTLNNLLTPFFVGWSGIPIATGNILQEQTLQEVYENVFTSLFNTFPELLPFVCLEIIGLASANQIYDRALKTRIDKGNTLITSKDNSEKYFSFQIIQNDMARNGCSSEQLVYLNITGVGFATNLKTEPLQKIQECIFYEPPKPLETSQVSKEVKPIKSHSHALGWKINPFPQNNFGKFDENSFWGREWQYVDEILLSRTLNSRPDYIVHLDAWTQIKVGFVRVFATPTVGCFHNNG